jgi:hypothetical protein
MNDRDLRAAFQRLEEDVTSHVSSDAGLDRITGRRLRFHPAFAAVAGAAAVVVVIGVAVLAFRPGSGAGPALPGTSISESTTVPSTTTSRPPSPARSSSPSPPEVPWS